MSNTQPLVDYWEQYSIITNEPSVVVESPSGSPPSSPPSLRQKPQAERRPSIPRRDRALSDTTAFEMTRPSLDPFHPALSLHDFTDTFGPLLFPLYRAALLHKRILLVTDAPVHEPCNYGEAEMFSVIIRLLTAFKFIISPFCPHYLNQFFRCSAQKNARPFELPLSSISEFMIYHIFHPLRGHMSKVGCLQVGSLAQPTMF